MSSLELTLLYLFAAVAGVVVCRSFKLPSMLGYLMAGVVIGPHAFALAQNSKSIDHLAEFGVVFLMFVIGLEFSFSKLRTMRKYVFGLGSLQLVLTMLVITCGFLALTYFAPSYWQLSWQTALALSCVFVMSSTAIVFKLMVDAAELDSEHGKRVVGILLFQDLAVVPLLVLIPALGLSAGSLWSSLAVALAKAVFIVGVLLIAGPRIMRWWLTLVARKRSEELIMLNLLLTTLGLAWLTEFMGLSLALGAFIAGMLVSETPFKHQVEADIRPFHDVLLGLFFITIGMKLDWHIVLERWGLVLLSLVILLVVKMVLVTLSARLWGATVGVSLRVGLYIAQAGEFGFVLLSLSQTNGLIDKSLFNPVLAAMVLSMLVTPLVIMYSNQIVMKLVSSDWMQQSLQMTQLARKAIAIKDHVIICGYGSSGHKLARLLKLQGVAYIALDIDPDRVQEASADAEGHVVFGDATRLPALMAAGLARANAVVVTYLNVNAALKVLAHTRAHAPQVPVVVRTSDDRDLKQLEQAGATAVVPEAIEGSLMLASHALALVGVPMRKVNRMVQNLRDARYHLLRDYTQMASSQASADEEKNFARLANVTLPQQANANGKTLADVNLTALGVHILTLRREVGQKAFVPSADTLFEAEDGLVLSGKPAALQQAIQKLLHG